MTVQLAQVDKGANATNDGLGITGAGVPVVGAGIKKETKNPGSSSYGAPGSPATWSEKKTNWWVWALVALVVAVGAVGVWYYYKKLKK